MVLLTDAFDPVVVWVVAAGVIVKIPEAFRCPAQFMGSLADPSTAPMDIEVCGPILEVLRGKSVPPDKVLRSNSEVFPLVRGHRLLKGQLGGGQPLRLWSGLIAVYILGTLGSDNVRVKRLPLIRGCIGQEFLRPGSTNVA